MAKKHSFLMYKGRPLVRNGKTLYYGYMSDPYVVIMQITSTRDVKGVLTELLFSLSTPIPMSE